MPSPRNMADGSPSGRKGTRRVVPARAAGERRQRPAARRRTHPAAQGGAEGHPRASSSKTSLALGEAVAAALADEGFKVDRAANGEEALARLRERHYDVIICDLKMPKVDGMMFFSEVSATMPQVARRLVFVTGDVAGTEAERFLEESGCRARSRSGCGISSGLREKRAG